MKKGITITTIASLVAMFMFSHTAFAGHVEKRQVRQHKRIYQGTKSGELTTCETRKLLREQRHIQRRKRSAWADGTLTPRERARLEYTQDKVSKHIYRAKHNNINR
ncbi:MAG: hypothetical protein SVW57_04715 [Thermodesulfobacteriota bacterium]|nr:hypothetical protein [Thermodesulfobacteriota bacterium]